MKVLQFPAFQQRCQFYELIQNPDAGGSSLHIVLVGKNAISFCGLLFLLLLIKLERLLEPQYIYASGAKKSKCAVSLAALICPWLIAYLCQIVAVDLE